MRSELQAEGESSVESPRLHKSVVVCASPAVRFGGYYSALDQFIGGTCNGA